LQIILYNLFSTTYTTTISFSSTSRSNLRIENRVLWILSYSSFFIRAIDDIFSTSLKRLTNAQGILLVGVLIFYQGC